MTSEEVNGKSNLNHLNLHISHLIIPSRIADRIQPLLCLRSAFFWEIMFSLCTFPFLMSSNEADFAVLSLANALTKQTITF
jgi:hypothetical protein